MNKKQDSSPKQTPDKQKKELNNFAKYTGIAFQMGAVIFAGVFGGFKLDQLLPMQFPLFTLLLSVIAVAGAIYLAIKDFIRMK